MQYTNTRKVLFTKNDTANIVVLYILSLIFQIFEIYLSMMSGQLNQLSS